MSSHVLTHNCSTQLHLATLHHHAYKAKWHLEEHVLLIRWFLRWRRPLAYPVPHCLTACLKHVEQFLSSCLSARVTKRDLHNSLSRQQNKFQSNLSALSNTNCIISIDTSSMLGLTNRIVGHMAGARRHHNAEGTTMLKALSVPLIPTGIWKEFHFPVKSMGKSLHFKQCLKVNRSLAQAGVKNHQVSFETHTQFWMCSQKTSF